MIKLQNGEKKFFSHQASKVIEQQTGECPKDAYMRFPRDKG